MAADKRGARGRIVGIARRCLEPHPLGRGQGQCVGEDAHHRRER